MEYMEYTELKEHIYHAMHKFILEHAQDPNTLFICPEWWDTIMRKAELDYIPAIEGKRKFMGMEPYIIYYQKELCFVGLT